MTQKGKDNPNWRGGRTVSSHGYILVRVGTDHHLADVRGYAYEHRLIAEKKLGRRLEPGELVHHKDENKQNNSPDNIEVLNGNGEHFVFHRGDGSNQRLPGEPNKTIDCECGCGETFEMYDGLGRPRSYVSGHNPQPAPTQNEILHILEKGSMHRDRIAQLCDKPVRTVATALSKLKKKGLVYQKGRGIWALQI